MIFNKGLIAVCKEKTLEELQNKKTPKELVCKEVPLNQVVCTYFKTIENGALSIRYKKAEQVYKVFNSDFKSAKRVFSFYNLPAKGYDKQIDGESTNEIHEEALPVDVESKSIIRSATLLCARIEVI